ncbi:MAG: glycosyltransferase [Alphaproteobacteria bacterium]|nr:glycosyltransferase [Alphaproteobacteria bacterium]
MKEAVKSAVRGAFAAYGRLQTTARELRIAPARRAAERAIAALPTMGPSLVDGPVLVDAAFQHPNYWQRFGLLRAALGFENLEQYALPGRFSTLGLAGTLRRMGIRHRLAPLTDAAAVAARRVEAREILTRAGDADGLFRAELPFGIPAFDLYDGLLRAQRTARVDLGHPDIADFVATWLAAAYSADDLVRRLRPGFAVLSHTQSGRDGYGVLARALIRHGVPMVVPNGFFENLHLHRVEAEPDLYRFFDPVEPEEIDAMPSARRESLAVLGRQAVMARLGGNSREFAGQLAFGPGQTDWSREEMCRDFGWDPAKPIVAILTSTWFDFPHLYGSSRFRDFADWVGVTLRAAAGAADVNFIVRGHPADRWYDGVYVSDMIGGQRAPNIGVCPYGKNGRSVMQAADALVTFYGSAALEYAMFGKPVLVPDIGWYHRHAFVRLAHSREDYADRIRRVWWRDGDWRPDPERAAIVQAYRFGYPAWQGDWRLDDDVACSRDRILHAIPARLAACAPAVRLELATIRDWYASGEILYHPFKIRRATELTHI